MLNYLTLLAISTLTNASQAAVPSAAAQAPVTSVGSLTDLPNTTIHYYDVTGKDVTAINRSIARQRPRAAGNKPAPAATNWIINTSFEQRREREQCKVSAARATFTATAELPRLVDEHGLARPLLARWRNYVARLEASEMATLVFVYHNLDQVERAVLASSCEGAKAAGAAAVEQLRSKAAAFELERQKYSRRSLSFAEDSGVSDRKADRPICKDLIGTGSRLNSLRVCMAPREWAKLHESGQQATREMQDKPRVNRPF